MIFYQCNPLLSKFFTIIFFLLVANILPGQVEKRYEFQHLQMGTTFNLIFYHSNTKQAQSIENQFIKKIEQLNTIFSDYLENSEISQLSATAGSGKKVKVSAELWCILKQAKWYSKKSKGAFDITIGPLSKLWRSMFRRSEIFDGVKINSAKSKVGFQKVKLYLLTKRVQLKQAGMRLDAGGIAKGFTVDEIVKILQKNGITKFLVDGGGDIYVGDAPPHKTGWSIKVSTENTLRRKVNKNLILTNTAIASSGDTYRFLEWEGKRYSHIIDPRTGYSVMNQKIVNVLAPTCTQADAIASTLSVLSTEEKTTFLKKMKRIKVF